MTMNNEQPLDQSVVNRIGCAILVVIGILAMMLLVILPAWFPRYEESPRANCTNNLKQFGIALHNYRDACGVFPPAYFADADGKPMHSWRIILLPYFEDPALKDLSKQYRFNEPWNSPHNLKLADKMPPVYRCPASDGPKGEANYLAVVGKETGWPGADSLTLRQIRDGTANTIALVEVANSGINWLDPRDLSVDEALQKIESQHTADRMHARGAHHLDFTGSVHFLNSDIDRETYRALLTANGGEKLTIPE